MKLRIHVNRGIIDSNRKHGTHKPAISIKQAGKKVVNAHDVSVSVDRSWRRSKEVVRIVSAHPGIRKPLNCGAKVWIEVELPKDVTIKTRRYK